MTEVTVSVTDLAEYHAQACPLAACPLCAALPDPDSEFDPDVLRSFISALGSRTDALEVLQVLEEDGFEVVRWDQVGNTDGIFWSGPPFTVAPGKEQDIYVDSEASDLDCIIQERDELRDRIAELEAENERLRDERTWLRQSRAGLMERVIKSGGGDTDVTVTIPRDTLAGWSAGDSYCEDYVNDRLTDALSTKEPEPTIIDRLQYMVDWAHKNGHLEEGAFTFPDGETWWAMGLEPTPEHVITEVEAEEDLIWEATVHGELGDPEPEVWHDDE